MSSSMLVVWYPTLTSSSVVSKKRFSTANSTVWLRSRVTVFLRTPLSKIVVLRVSPKSFVVLSRGVNESRETTKKSYRASSDLNRWKLDLMPGWRLNATGISERGESLNPGGTTRTICVPSSPSVKVDAGTGSGTVLKPWIDGVVTAHPDGMVAAATMAATLRAGRANCLRVE